MADLTKELAEYLRSVAPIDFKEIDGKTVVAMVPNGMSLKSVKPLLDEYRLTPERKKGQATLTDLASFIAHANRFKDGQSALFASPDPGKPTLTSVLNYHEATSVPSAVADAASVPGQPRFGDHRGVYAFPLSKEWEAWGDQDGEKMEQAAFAQFLEERIVDVLDPPDATSPDQGDPVVQLQRIVGGAFAGPTKLVELSRGMALSAEMKVKGAVNLSSGEATIQFEETHTDGAGAPLKVPSLFVIGIPVFDGGPLYRIGVRLRYRAGGGRVVWFYNLYRAEKAFDDAFNEACVKAQADTSLPLFYGAPE